MSEEIVIFDGEHQPVNELKKDELYEQRIDDLFLERAKLVLKEMSVEQANMLIIGELKGLTPKEHWTGNISLQSRLESGDLTDMEVEDGLYSLNQFFVPVTEGAPKRCVDGRTKQGYNDNDPDSFAQPLGPQIQGGTEGEVIGERLANGYNSGVTYIDDFKRHRDNGKSKFIAGGHTGSHADPATGKTDCGQRDGEIRRLSKYEGSPFNSAMAILGAIYEKAGLPFPDDKAVKLQKNALALVPNAKSYFKDIDKMPDLIKSENPRALEYMLNEHNEVSLTINLVPSTTFHRDHYNAQTYGKIQNFNLDAWNIVEEHGEDAFYILADAVTTLMDLTDGSMRVGIRMPVTETSPVAV